MGKCKKGVGKRLFITLYVLVSHIYSFYSKDFGLAID